MKLFSAYPYLITSIIMLFISFTGIIFYKENRVPTIISALLSTPYAFLSVFFVPFYWTPVRILTFWHTGIEDIFFSFANGAIVWILSTFIIRKRISLNLKIKHLLFRYITCVFLSGAFGIFLLVLGVNPMHETLIVIVVMTAVLLYFKKHLWIFSVTGAISFGTFYTIICCTLIILKPDFFSQWNIDALTGYYIMRIPIEEIIWGIAFGAIWPLIMAYLFDTIIKI